MHGEYVLSWGFCAFIDSTINKSVAFILKMFAVKATPLFSDRKPKVITERAIVHTRDQRNKYSLGTSGPKIGEGLKRTSSLLVGDRPGHACSNSDFGLMLLMP